MTAPATTTEATAATTKTCPCWLWAALAVNAAGVAGSLGLTWALGLDACPLCFYQRVFALAALGALVIGVLLPELKPGRASLFALPSAMAGFAVAVFHVNLVASGKLECPEGFAGLGQAPVQSLVFYALLLAALALDLVEARKSGHGIPAITLGISALGLLFAISLIYSSPAPPRPDYDKPLTVCRPPKPSSN